MQKTSKTFYFRTKYEFVILWQDYLKNMPEWVLSGDGLHTRKQRDPVADPPQNQKQQRGIDQWQKEDLTADITGLQDPAADQ